MAWRVVTLDEVVDDELQALPAGMRAKFVHIAEMLEKFGPFQVREPYVKSLGGRLYEIRMKSTEGIARAIYTPAGGQRLVVLHAFVKKTQKLPNAAIRIALKRAREVQ